METKNWLSSLTIQGSLVGTVPAMYAVSKTFGLNLPDGTLEAVVNGVAALMAIASVVMTFVGRLRATQKIAL